MLRSVFLAGSKAFAPCRSIPRAYGTLSKELVNIVEVGPRDGLQNEKAALSVNLKVELINRLARAGLKTIEAGSFVSPKWVPQMANTAEVITTMERLPSVNYQVLVPNQRGLDLFLPISSSANDIAVFVSATDAFSMANTNCSVQESLVRIRPVVRTALDAGLRVRGYVSVVVACPYSGQVDYKKVRELSQELIEMGCYEVSLGDTVGMGTPASISEMLEEVKKSVSVDKLAGHFHDTYGTAVANVFRALEHGVRTIDTSVGGLGGCPYSPGATGNVATEDVVYALRGSQYTTGDINLDQLSEIGHWITGQLGRETSSRAGKALRLRKVREQGKAKETDEPVKAKL